MESVFELSEEEIQELNYGDEILGPSSKGCCRVTISGVCGSGSLVGFKDGKSLVLTNAHVAGKVGRKPTFEFPFLNKKKIPGEVIFYAYSDRTMMDWAICLLEEKVFLPHTRLSKDKPTGEHYTFGYPGCKGPYSQKLKTVTFTHNGTVMRWQPNSKGGQSGSGVHSYQDNFQKALLTWSWAGDGAGQTGFGIWAQYRAAIQGFELAVPRPEGLVELCERHSDLENGINFQADIADLDIWAHMIDTPPPTDPGNPICKVFAEEVLKKCKTLQDEIDLMEDLAKKYLGSGGGGISNPPKPPTDGTFGL